MDAYEVYKKIQEAIMAVEVYDVRRIRSTSIWDQNIKKGIDDLVRKCDRAFPPTDANTTPGTEERIARLG